MKIQVGKRNLIQLEVSEIFLFGAFFDALTLFIGIFLFVRGLSSKSPALAGRFFRLWWNSAHPPK